MYLLSLWSRFAAFLVGAAMYAAAGVHDRYDLTGSRIQVDPCLGGVSQNHPSGGGWEWADTQAVRVPAINVLYPDYLE